MSPHGLCRDATRVVLGQQAHAQHESVDVDTSHWRPFDLGAAAPV